MKKYYVMHIKGYDEFEILKTDDLEKAIKEAQDQQYINKRDGNKGEVEIRMYREDIEDEDCDCFDYDTVEF